MLNVYFWNNEKMFEIDLNSDLREKPDLKSRLLYITWTGKARILNMSEVPNVGKYASAYLLCEYAWACAKYYLPK